MSAPEPRSPLADVRRAGRFGAAGANPVRLAERPAAIVQVSARRGAAAVCAERVRAGLALDLPPPGRSSVAGDLAAIWIQPEGWLVVGPRDVDGALAERLVATVGDAGSIVDQSHGKTMLTVSGASARGVMAKGCRLDLHPSVFATGSSAVIQISEIGCVIRQLDDLPSFALIVPSSLVETFWEWLTVSAAEYGYVVE